MIRYFEEEPYQYYQLKINHWVKTGYSPCYDKYKINYGEDIIGVCPLGKVIKRNWYFGNEIVWTSGDKIQDLVIGFKIKDRTGRG